MLRKNNRAIGSGAGPQPPSSRGRGLWPPPWTGHARQPRGRARGPPGCRGPTAAINLIPPHIKVTNTDRSVIAPPQFDHYADKSDIGKRIPAYGTSDQLRRIFFRKYVVSSPNQDLDGFNINKLIKINSYFKTTGLIRFNP